MKTLKEVQVKFKCIARRLDDQREKIADINMQYREQRTESKLHYLMHKIKLLEQEKRILERQYNEALKEIALY